MDTAELAVVDGTRAQKRVLAATLVGTTIEWYDFFVYAQAAGLVFGPAFFAPVEKHSPGLAQILSFASIGISFLFRPLGAAICGHLGDRFGRRIVLVFTLIMMGAATALIGVLPTYAQIGPWAPMLLIALRILQGFSAGGEWGGAALMSVEHAPRQKRSLFGAAPQIGTPLGMIISTGVLWVLTETLGKQAMAAWGWRLPFLLSIALIFIGAIVRRTLEESPVYEAMRARHRQSSAPLGELMRSHGGQVLSAALIFMANNAVGYVVIAFFISYGQKALHISPGTMLLIGTLSAGGWFVFTLLGGWLGDRLGRVPTFQVGYGLMAAWTVPMWFLIDTGNPALFLLAALVLTAALGLSYGPQAALYAEMFPARVRYSGVSVGYALGAILGGAFAPAIAQWLITSIGKSWTIGVYLAGLSVISLIAVSLVKHTTGIDLDAA
ncbi:MFS transporter [Paraburkholderia oxyphila]|uniref:MFS transporter n=1 Tax=Paraburkholderia oxyphila TaxID=614212 RepID=UPI0004885DD1|nr:MFS transporter [Paraburkholderia oxyphila]